MLQVVSETGDSMKRAYTSFMDFAVVPFVYATWYNENLFSHPTWFSYGYLATGILVYAAKEIVHQYKLANPLLPEEYHHTIIRTIDACFKGLSSVTEMIFPAIILDVIYKIKEIFSKQALSIIHPIYISAAVSYGVYKGLDHYGVFKAKKDRDSRDASTSSEVIWKKVERNVQMEPSELEKLTLFTQGDPNESNHGHGVYTSMEP